MGRAGVDQVVEFVEVGFHHRPEPFPLGGGIGFGEHFEAKAQPGDGRAAVRGISRRQFLLGGDRLLDAVGHAVQGIERGEELAAGGRARVSRWPSPRFAGGLADRFEVAPDGTDPEPQGDGENDADQAPGQEPQPQIEGMRSCSSWLRWRPAADHQHFAARPQAVVHDLAVVVDGDVAGVEPQDLGAVRMRSRVMRSTMSRR